MDHQLFCNMDLKERRRERQKSILSPFYYKRYYWFCDFQKIIIFENFIVIQ